MRARAGGRVGLIVLSAFVLFSMAACSDPAHVETLTVANGTEYPADVSVSDEDGGEWLPLGLVGADEARSFRNVLDQGERWTFRYEYFAEHPVEVSLDRADLEGARWRLEVPGSYATELEQEGIEPPP